MTAWLEEVGVRMLPDTSLRLDLLRMMEGNLVMFGVYLILHQYLPTWVVDFPLIFAVFCSYYTWGKPDRLLRLVKKSMWRRMMQKRSVWEV